MATPPDLLAFGISAALGIFSLYSGALLLRLRGTGRARDLLGIALVANGVGTLVIDAGILSYPRNADIGLFGDAFDLCLAISWLAGILFLTRFPRPISWKGWQAPIFVVILAFGVIAAVGNEACHHIACDQNDPLSFGSFSVAHSALAVIALALAYVRTPELPEPEATSARYILVAVSTTAILFLGYAILQFVMYYANLPYRARYRFTGAWTLNDVINNFAFVAAAGLGITRGARRLAGLLLAAGAFAFLVDQLTPHDLIDLGLANLVLPLVALREVTQRGALGVQRVPARMALPVAATGGIATLIGVLALTNLIAPDSPFLLAMGLVAGIAAGVSVTYALRPRDVAITILRTSTHAPARPQDTRLAPGVRVGTRYIVESKLGEGAEGDAWVARDDVIERRVVLKAVRPGGVREARLVGSLRDPHVIQVYDVVETHGATLLVLELAEGGDLRGLLDRTGPLPESQADQILRGVLRGLVAVHEKGIIHGDIKPENVLLDASGSPKLADFGIAGRPQGPAATVVAASGTLGYMSPEQARGESPTAASDLYAAGLLYQEMLTGHPTHATAGLDGLQLRALIATQEARVNVPGARGDLLTRALARDPAARFATAAQMLDALQQAVR